MEDRGRSCYRRGRNGNSYCEISPRTIILRAIVVFSVIAILSNRQINAAPTHEDGLPHSLELSEYISDANSCYYNYQRYEEGDRIITNEPCLNCTCHNRMLMCYLKVCPFSKPIGQDCTVEKSPEQCCPIITCPEVPVRLLTSSTTISTTSTTEIAIHDDYGCTVGENVFYPDGAQVPSDPKKPCELCYCIRNHTTCVIQECTLHVEGCEPVLKDDVCCPVRYDCVYEKDQSTTESSSFVGLVRSTTPAISADCRHNGKFYSDGELITTAKPCEHCYCMHGDIVCAVQDCGKPFHGKDCTPITPSGQCCPSSYECANETYTTTTTEALTVMTTISSKPYDSVSTENISASAESSDEQIQNDKEEQTTVTNADQQIYTHTQPSSPIGVPDSYQKLGENNSPTAIITDRHSQTTQPTDSDHHHHQTSIDNLSLQNDNNALSTEMIITTTADVESSSTSSLTTTIESSSSSSSQPDQPIKQRIPLPTTGPYSEDEGTSSTIIIEEQQQNTDGQHTTTFRGISKDTADVVNKFDTTTAFSGLSNNEVVVGNTTSEVIPLSEDENNGQQHHQQHASELFGTSPFQLDTTTIAALFSSTEDVVATGVKQPSINDSNSPELPSADVVTTFTPESIPELTTEQESISTSSPTSSAEIEEITKLSDKVQTTTAEQYSETTTDSAINDNKLTKIPASDNSAYPLKEEDNTEKSPDFIADVQSSHENKPNAEQSFTTTISQIPEDKETTSSSQLPPVTVAPYNEGSIVTVKIEEDVTTTVEPIKSSYEKVTPSLEDQQQHQEVTTEEDNLASSTYDYDSTSKFFLDIAYTESTGIPGEGSCLVRGKTYSNFSAIPSTDPCHDKCICMSSIPVCTTVKCSLLPTSDKLKCTIRVEPDACCPIYICESSAPSSPLESNNQVMDASNNEATTTSVNQEYSKDVVTTVVPESEPSIPTSSQQYDELVGHVQDKEQHSSSEHYYDTSTTAIAGQDDNSGANNNVQDKLHFPCTSISSTNNESSVTAHSEPCQTTTTKLKIPDKIENEDIDVTTTVAYSDNNYNTEKATTIGESSKETTVLFDNNAQQQQQPEAITDSNTGNKEQNIAQDKIQSSTDFPSSEYDVTADDKIYSTASNIDSSQSSYSSDKYAPSSESTPENVNPDDMQSGETTTAASGIQEDGSSATPAPVSISDDLSKNKVQVTTNSEILSSDYYTTSPEVAVDSNTASSIKVSDSINEATTKESAYLPSDGGSVTSDGGSVTSDGGSVTSDGGSVTSDGGSVTSDGGSVTSDGGSVTSDEGSVTSDEGSVTSDGGSVTSDVGSVTSEESVVDVTSAGSIDATSKVVSGDDVVEQTTISVVISSKPDDSQQHHHNVHESDDTKTTEAADNVVASNDELPSVSAGTVSDSPVKDASNEDVTTTIKTTVKDSTDGVQHTEFNDKLAQTTPIIYSKFNSITTETNVDIEKPTSVPVESFVVATNLPPNYTIGESIGLSSSTSSEYDHYSSDENISTTTSPHSETTEEPYVVDNKIPADDNKQPESATLPPHKQSDDDIAYPQNQNPEHDISTQLPTTAKHPYSDNLLTSRIPYDNEQFTNTPSINDVPPTSPPLIKQPDSESLTSPAAEHSSEVSLIVTTLPQTGEYSSTTDLPPEDNSITTDKLSPAPEQDSSSSSSPLGSSASDTIPQKDYPESDVTSTPETFDSHYVSPSSQVPEISHTIIPSVSENGTGDILTEVPSPEKDHSSSGPAEDNKVTSLPDETSDKLNTFKIPDRNEVSSEIPDRTEVSSEIPDRTEVSSEIPDRTEVSSEIPDRNEVSSEIPDRNEVSSEIPDRTEVSSEIPDRNEVSSEIPDRNEVSSEIPDKNEVSSGIPDRNEVSSEIPDTNDVSLSSSEVSPIVAASSPEDEQSGISPQKEEEPSTSVIDKTQQSEDDKSQQQQPAHSHVQENSLYTESDNSDNRVTTSPSPSKDVVKPSTPGKYKPSPSPHNTSESNYHHHHPEDEGSSGGIHQSSEDEYEDEVFGPGTCRYGGKLYVSAQQIPREDPCDFCFCFRSDIICLRQSCPPPIQGCRQEPIPGFCCPRYECPVPSTSGSRFTTSSSPFAKTSTLPSSSHLFPENNYRTVGKRTGCSVNGYFYRVGDEITVASGPCLRCVCGKDGSMKCDPRPCNVEHGMQQMMEEALTFK